MAHVKQIVLSAARWQTPSMDQCDECGFSYGDVDQDGVVAEVRAAGDRYRVALTGVTAERLRVRTDPSVWSLLEYAAHVRDVLLAQRERILLALVVDAPAFFAMYRDERVELAGYGEEAEADVVAGIDLAGSLLGHLFARLDDQQLRRPCIYGYPEPERHDVLWVGQRTVHEIRHHLLDVERGRAALDARDVTPGGSPDGRG